MKRSSLAAGLIAASIFVAVLSIPQVASAETVTVKYRGQVDLKPFKCETIYQSSVVKRLCYDAKEEYVVVSLISASTRATSASHWAAGLCLSGEGARSARRASRFRPF